MRPRSFPVPALAALVAMLALGLAAGPRTVRAAAFPAFSPDTAGFLLHIKDQVWPYRVMGLFVLPGESVLLEVSPPVGNDQFVLHAPVGTVVELSPNRWTWAAPGKPGTYQLSIFHPFRQQSMTLNVFVMTPSRRLRHGYLNGYHIGSYPRAVFRNLPAYAPPRGFVEVDETNEDVRLSPHFRLGQFVDKQQKRYPAYVALQERLFQVLELVLQAVNAHGIHANTFHIMSGYRTPFYNAAVGNETIYSRHSWGDASDIFVDEHPEDGVMDDLNHDGRVDVRDAQFLQSIIEETLAMPGQAGYQGGLGVYASTRAHGPFVHVDARGYRARWGQLLASRAVRLARTGRLSRSTLSRRGS